MGVGGVGGGVDGGLSQKRKGRVGLGGLEAPNGTGANGDVSVNGGLRIGVNGGGGGGGSRWLARWLARFPDCIVAFI